MSEVEQLKADVTKELTVMKEIGMSVPKKAFDRAQSDSEIEECLDGAMSVSEIADMFISLS